MDQEKVFKNVYLEFPENIKKEEPVEDNKELEEKEEAEKVITKTTKLSREELQRRLEETQSLHV